MIRKVKSFKLAVFYRNSVHCEKLQQVFEVLSFGPNTGPQSFCHSFIALSIIVIEPILVLNLVRARSSWLGLGTEPPADRSPIRRRIV